MEQRSARAKTLTPTILWFGFPHKKGQPVCGTAASRWGFLGSQGRLLGLGSMCHETKQEGKNVRVSLFAVLFREKERESRYTMMVLAENNDNFRGGLIRL